MTPHAPLLTDAEWERLRALYPRCRTPLASPEMPTREEVARLTALTDAGRELENEPTPDGATYRAYCNAYGFLDCPPVVTTWAVVGYRKDGVRFCWPGTDDEANERHVWQPGLAGALLAALTHVGLGPATWWMDSFRVDFRRDGGPWETDPEATRRLCKRLERWTSCPDTNTPSGEVRP